MIPLSVQFDKDNRLIYLMGDIEESDVCEICYDIITINQLDDKQEEEKKKYERKPIKFYINSYGGNVYEMFALIDTMLNSKTPIHTICTGYVMSAGFLIFITGHKRIATSHATFMIHQISGGAYGKFYDILNDVEEYDRVNLMIISHICRKTSIPRDTIKRIWDTKTDYFFDIGEASGYDIVDEVIDCV